MKRNDVSLSNDLHRIEYEMSNWSSRLSAISEIDNWIVITDRSDTLQTDGNQDRSIYGDESVFLSSL